MGKGASDRGLGAEEEEQINIDPGVLQHVLRLTISFFASPSHGGPICKEREDGAQHIYIFIMYV